MIPFLHLGPLTVPTYGLMVACAMVAAFFVLRADLKRRGLGSDSGAEAEALIAVPCLAGIAGAKLYHVFESPRELFANPVGQIFSQFGFAWFGGLIAGFAAFLWLARSIAKRSSTSARKISLLEFLDAGSPAAALGYGVGRIGCLLSGDGDYGIPTSLPWGMSFPHGLVPTTQRVHPTPIYELIAACLIAWLLWRLGARAIQSPQRSDNRHLAGLGTAGRGAARRAASSATVRGASANVTAHTVAAGQALAHGQVFAAYLVLTGLARFLVEFIRINPRSFFGMSNAQTAGLASVIVGAILWWKLPRKLPARVSRTKS